jgi:hexosaminidase
VATDAHHGFTGGQAKDNAYTVKIDAYETGAAFKVRAYIYGDEGNDSNGVVLIRKMP